MKLFLLASFAVLASFEVHAADLAIPTVQEINPQPNCLNDGVGMINGATGDTSMPVTAFMCTMCQGTGKRPTDEELARRRLTQSEETNDANS